MQLRYTATERGAAPDLFQKVLGRAGLHAQEQRCRDLRQCRRLVLCCPYGSVQPLLQAHHLFTWHIGMLEAGSALMNSEIWRPQATICT